MIQRFLLVGCGLLIAVVMLVVGIIVAPMVYNAIEQTNATGVPGQNTSQLPSFPTTEQEAQQVLQTDVTLTSPAAGQGWHADTGTIHVYPGLCVDVADANQINFPTTWTAIENDSSGSFTRALASGEGTAIGPVTVYWSGCVQ